MRTLGHVTMARITTGNSDRFHIVVLENHSIASFSRKSEEENV